MILLFYMNKKEKSELQEYLSIMINNTYPVDDLKELNLTGCTFLSERILKLIIKLPKLETLILAGCGIKTFNFSLFQNKCIQKLDLNGNHINSIEIDDSIKIKQLWLDNNKIENLILNNSTIEELDCDNNPLSKAYIHCSNLQKISMLSLETEKVDLILNEGLDSGLLFVNTSPIIFSEKNHTYNLLKEYKCNPKLVQKSDIMRKLFLKI